MPEIPSQTPLGQSPREKRSWTSSWTCCAIRWNSFAWRRADRASARASRACCFHSCPTRRSSSLASAKEEGSAVRARPAAARISLRTRPAAPRTSSRISAASSDTDSRISRSRSSSSAPRPASSARPASVIE